MKHFLDFGTHLFQGLAQFTEQLSLDETWEVQCYEANPFTYEESQPKRKEFEGKFKSFSHNNLAIMDQDGVITMNCHKGAWDPAGNYHDEFTSGSNALDNTPTYDAGIKYVFDIVKTEVECIGVDSILSDICSRDPEAEIYIKCDIEGSEFAILPTILESIHTKNIVEMYVEWHERFWFESGEYQERVAERKFYENQFKKLGVSMYTHH